MGWHTEKQKPIELMEFNFPIWLHAEALRVVISMETFEEEGKAPTLCKTVQGAATLSRNPGISIIDKPETYTDTINLVIESLNYDDIAKVRKERIKRYGSDDDISLNCEDKLATDAILSHREAEYSEVGKLWDESWTLHLLLPENLMNELLNSIASGQIEIIELGVKLVRIYEEKSDNDFLPREKESSLYVKPLGDGGNDNTVGYVDSLTMATRNITSGVEEQVKKDDQQTELIAVLNKIKWGIYIAAFLLFLVIILN